MSYRYATIKFNNISAGPGVCLTLFTQGCPKNPHCKGCHNPETWDFNGGKEFTYDTLSSILHGLIANNIFRDLAIQGGEPLCKENLSLVKKIVSAVRASIPQTIIYIWTGYLYEDLLKNSNPDLKYVLSEADFLIDGPYIEKERDVSLFMRGSRNQRIWNLKEGKVVSDESLQI